MSGPTDLSHLAAVLEGGWSSPWSCPDVAGLDPIAAIGELVASGYAALAVPAEHQGAGCTLLELAAVQRQLGRASGSLAIAANMHTFTIGVIKEHWRREHDLSWILLEAVAESGSLVASAFAEPGGTLSVLDARMVAVPDGKGYRVTGSKFPCSLVTTARLVCLNARVEGSDTIIVGLTSADAPEVARDPTWPSIGMTGSDTGRLDFDDLFIDERLVFYERRDDAADGIATAGIVWFSVLVAATYHGCLSALVYAIGDGSWHRDAGSRAALGRALRALVGLGAQCRSLATEWEAGTLAGESALAAALALRADLVERRNQVLANVVPVVGSRAYRVDDPIGQLVLDCLALDHHPPRAPHCDASLGGTVAGRPVTLDPIREPFD